MYCKYCGGKLEGTEKFCSYCGKPTTEEKTDAQTAQKDFCPRCGQALQPGDQTCAFCGNPVGANAAPFYTAPSQPAYSPQPSVKEKKGTPFGIAALVLAFFSPILGIVFGIIAITQGRSSENKTAIVLGIIAIVVAVIMWITNMLWIYPILKDLLGGYEFY